MNAPHDVPSLIETSPDAVLILSQDRGRVVWASESFLLHSNFNNDGICGLELAKLPFSSPHNKRGLLRLFVKVLRYKEDKKGFAFRYVSPTKEIRKGWATASLVFIDNKKYVVISIKNIPVRKTIQMEELDWESWNAQSYLGFEPYLEFRPSVPFQSPLEGADRKFSLQRAASSFYVKRANHAAQALYAGENGTLTGRSFASFFQNADDALRFMDMLTIVGEMKAETTVTTFGGKSVDIEMHCLLKLERDESIAALYCAQRNMFKLRYYEALIGGSRAEMDFTFNQPFLGLGLLMPSEPIPAPDSRKPDEELDAVLEKILIVRANQAMLDLYGAENVAFLMKPMTALFSDQAQARQLLKDLFIQRECRIDTPQAILFRATFNGSGHLSGIMVAIAQKHAGEN